MAAHVSPGALKKYFRKVSHFYHAHATLTKVADRPVDGGAILFDAGRRPLADFRVKKRAAVFNIASGASLRPSGGRQQF